MIRLAGLLLLALPAGAHVVSMSSGDLTIQGNSAHYELRLPLYEVPHVADPAQSLFTHIRFGSRGRQAEPHNQSCREAPAENSYVCEADYDFGQPVESVDVECTFPAITVPNHVHLLRAENGGKHDQALFDISFPHASLRFRPPTAFETFAVEAGGGVMRALGGWVQILFMTSLVLAARSRREMVLLAGMFLTGQVAAAVIVSHSSWQPSPRFVEAAAALTVAYLAIEILILPAAGMRWLVLCALGAFHGLFLSVFLTATRFNALYVLSGAVAGEVIFVCLLAVAFSWLGKRLAALKPVPVSASLLLVFGLAWFFLRLRN